MKRFILTLMVCAYCGIAAGQKKTGKEHYVCIQAPTTYHDKEHCAALQMCSGGKIRKTRNIDHLQPCRKCARPVYLNTSFANIRRILGVKDRKQIADSLGTAESTIRRPEGFFMRISGPPDSRTVNTLEFYLNRPVPFDKDTLLAKSFYDLLGLQFDGCKADTIKNTKPHPVTGKVPKDITIEYRGCPIVEKRDQYEDVSRYYYELTFVAKETDRIDILDKIQLILRIDK